MDTNITKQRMADSFKKLTEKKLFSAISVSDICDDCGMHRKSFYYHFKDKYDLVAWIYDTELEKYIENNSCTAGITGHITACRGYLYENRDYYNKLLAVEGQNSFSEHFRGRVYIYVDKTISEIFTEENIHGYQIDFIADGIATVMLKWIKDKEDITPDQLVEK